MAEAHVEDKFVPLSATGAPYVEISLSSSSLLSLEIVLKPLPRNPFSCFGNTEDGFFCFLSLTLSTYTSSIPNYFLFLSIAIIFPVL